MKLYIKCGELENTPKWYAPAYLLPLEYKMMCVLIPLNLVVGPWVWLWRWASGNVWKDKKASELGAMLRDEYLRGKSAGFSQGYDAGFLAAKEIMEAELRSVKS